MSLHHQLMLDSRGGCCSTLGTCCHMFAVICSLYTCFTMDVSSRWHLLSASCFMPNCQFWYTSVSETIAFDGHMKTFGYQCWLLWLYWTCVITKFWAIHPCYRCFVLYVDHNNIDVWDIHQGVGSDEKINLNLVLNE